MGRQSRMKKGDVAPTPQLEDRLQKKAKQQQTNRRWTMIYIAIAVAVVVLLAGVALNRNYQKRQAVNVKDTVTIETSKGTIVMELYPKAMPTTVANFEQLATSGFYNGLKWHRVEDWVVQTGDPTGTGGGGSDKTIKLEIYEGFTHTRGAVGMARSLTSEDSASSQFYIIKQDMTAIDGSYAIFGRVVQGMDIVDQLTTTDTMNTVTVVKAK